MSVRVRFAPSPTGYLHVGGLRTALYNYLFARKQGGVFILRIEDTDRSRYVENSVENLIESLTWAGLDFDEGPHIGGAFGPYFQSQRLDIYQKYTDLLIKTGKAYFAFDTPEELEQMRNSNFSENQRDFKYKRSEGKNQYTLGTAATDELISKQTPFVIRLLVPENKNLVFHDLIRGTVQVHSSDIDEQVLLKSDGFPTYHLANVVDDHLMKITHVIRGEEWLPSTPKHILLYEAFEWEAPLFAHLPLLLNKDKSKLSKRQGSVAVEDFRNKGYLRDAFLNFISLLGWNPSGDQEIYKINDLISKFDVSKVNKGGAVFDVQKLDWMNAQYLKQETNDNIAIMLKNELSKRANDNFSIEYLNKIASLFKERVVFIHEIPTIAEYMFSEPKNYEIEYFKKHWKESSYDHLCALNELYSELENFTHDELLNLTKSFSENHGMKLKDVIHPLRLAITGKSAGAGMFETMEVLGKLECTIRISHFLKISDELKNYEQ
ncbi:MAG: glutamate--tRNA ligase [Candidatus Kapabacteria bacterium]|nr:glutamate--tRNA ligase [Candidatus Kapabacteria bacterium]